MRQKILIAFAAAVALSCVPVATNALAAPHGHAAGGHATPRAGLTFRNPPCRLIATPNFRACA